MTKSKAPPGKKGLHPSGHSVAADTHINHKKMDKVKIKRVKRTKKHVSTKEKILAGIGLGGALMGGAAISSQTPQSEFVRTQDQSSTASKVKDTLRTIFKDSVVQKAQAANDVGDIEESPDENIDEADTSTDTTANPDIETDGSESVDDDAPGTTTDTTTEDDGGEVADEGDDTTTTNNGSDVGDTETDTGESTDEAGSDETDIETDGGETSDEAWVLTLDTSSVTVTAGSTATVHASDVAISVTSSNPFVATASANTATGSITITGIAAGSATITVHLTQSGSDTSGDKQISVTVNAQSTNSGNNGSTSGYNGGGGSGNYGELGGVGTGNTSSYTGLEMQYGGSGSQSGQGSTFTGGTYTVKKGDTLWGISQRYYGTGTQWRKILSANPKSLSIPGNVRTLRIGYQLTIPGSDGSQAVTQSYGGSGSSYKHVTPTGPTYTVQSGDTLSAIAQAYYGDSSQWPKIMSANADKISSPRTMQVGIVLNIPGASASNGTIQSTQAPAQVQSYEQENPVAAPIDPVIEQTPPPVQEEAPPLANPISPRGTTSYTPPAETQNPPSTSVGTNIGDVEGGEEVVD